MTYKITKGLDINIPGTAQRHIAELADANYYAVKPSDYVGMVPRLLVAEGDSVKAGTPLLEDKQRPGIPFVSPVSGVVHAVVRGEKRTLLAVVVKSDGKQESVCFPTFDIEKGDYAADNRDLQSNLRKQMIDSGLWTLLRQRPFGIVPPADSKPKAVFVSAFDSSPLPVDYEFVLQDRVEDFQMGITILACIVGKVHISLGKLNNKKAPRSFTSNMKPPRGTFFTNIQNAEIHSFEGKHPASLVGTQIAKIDPINKGEQVWTVNPQDVAIIGHLFRTGEYRPERTVALCGPVVKDPHYVRLVSGVSLRSLGIESTTGNDIRLICGDVLSGTAESMDGFLSSSCDKVSVLPEGDYYDFLGWLRPNFKKFSFSRTFLSGFLSRFKGLTPKYDFDTGRHGSHRPLFVTGEFEKLTPLDIYPMQLIKACIIGDIELMENLGIYEVEPEDLALCEFADTSKTEIQAIIRNALETIRKDG